MSQQQILNSQGRTTLMIRRGQSVCRRQSNLSAITKKAGKTIVSFGTSLVLTETTNLLPAGTRPNLRAPPQNNRTHEEFGLLETSRGEQPDDLELGLLTTSGRIVGQQGVKLDQRLHKIVVLLSQIDQGQSNRLVSHD
jgi:hypothetical protein